MIARSLLAIALLAVSLGLAACSQDSGRDLAAPTSSDEGPVPAGDADAVVWEGPQADQGMALGILRTVVRKVTELVNGLLGGTVRNGRFQLDFPPGSFLGILPVTIFDLGRSTPTCDLFPEGLLFQRPVRLTIDVRGTEFDNDDSTILWWDPDREEWIDVGGHYSPERHTISTELEHFSTYGVGRRRDIR
jgi:hypothetical protein